MKILFSWLKEYVQIDEEPSKIAEMLSLTGTAVESVIPIKPGLNDVMVVEVLKLSKHPKADKLSIAEVNTGTKKLSIVCGAPNIRKGQKVPLVLPGAILQNKMKVEAREIRGVFSEGMICSEAELEIGEDKSGIMVLDDNLTPGTSFRNALLLDDYLLEFDILPNRPDCLSVVGISREIAAITGKILKKPEIKIHKELEDINNLIKISIEDDNLCPRYSAKMISDVRIEQSPFWMRWRLKNAGVRPINNIVDVTNYVMMELGQPLHAFDYEKISKKEIVIRRAFQNEILETLDEVKRELSENMLLIADVNEAIAIAGIMGGAVSEVREGTETILIESAHFDPYSISRTSKQVGLISEASVRFERGVDPEGTVYAAERAAQLISEFSGGRVHRGVVDEYPKKIKPKIITLRTERVNKILGTDIGKNEICDYLNKLELETKEESGKHMVTTPSFRFDLEREIDLIEEVVRLFGYNSVKSTLPESKKKRGFLSIKQKQERALRNILTGCGLNEIITYTFIDPKSFDLLNIGDGHQLRNAVIIENPTNREQSILRTTLLPGMLLALKRNHNRGLTGLSFFEMGKVFHPKKMSQPEERENVAILLSGFMIEKEWYEKGKKVDFFDGKGILEEVFSRFGIKRWNLKKGTHPGFHPQKYAGILAEEETFGYIGELHPSVQENFSLDFNVICIELDLQKIYESSTTFPGYDEFSKFPAITYDISLIVDEDVCVEDISLTIKEAEIDNLFDCKVFDVYQGNNIQKNKKSLAFSLIFQSLERTLTEEEVKKSFERIKVLLNTKYKAEIRSV